MGKYLKGFALMEDENYQMAYHEFSQIINKNSKDYSAYYYRGMIDFYFLKKNIPQTKTDFEIVLQYKPKFAKKLYGPLAILSDIINSPDETIIYGQLALADEDIYQQPELALEVNFALSKAFFNKANTKNDYRIAMDYLDKCIEMSEDDSIELYLCKCDIFMALDEYQNVLDLVDKMMIIFSFRPAYYLLKARAMTNIARLETDEKIKKEHLEDALSLFDIYFQYEENDALAYFYQADILRLLGRFDEAISTYEKILDKPEIDEPELFKDEFIIAIMMTYEMNKQINEAKNYAEEYLQKHSSWRVELGLAELIINYDEQGIEQAINLMHHAYHTSQKIPIAITIIETYQRLNRFPECLNWLENVINEEPYEGRWYFYLADILQKMGYANDEIIPYYHNSYQLGYLDDLEHLDMILPLIKNPRPYYPKLKAFSRRIDFLWANDDEYPRIEAYVAHKQAVRSTLGMHGMKVDLKRAYNYAFYCHHFYPLDCCFNTSLGRTFEMMGQKQDAFNIYHEGYLNLMEEKAPTCYCVAGYLAHCYYQGIGVTKDEKKAMALVLNAFNHQQERSDSSVLYLYAHFALIGKEGFTIETAIRNLEFGTSFQRYEIARYKMLMLLYQKRNITVKDLPKKLKIAYLFDCKLARKHYRKHRNDNDYYPFFNHY